jgi:nucleotide-binding universal stress UspA family protein
MPIRTILVPTDFSQHSDAAFERALEVAGSFSAKLVLLHSYWVSISMAASIWVVPPEFMDKLAEGARKLLVPLERRAIGDGVRCEVRLTTAPIVDAILEAAESLPADLIAMGTHGHTGLRHAVLGSTAERIVRLAPCPVLTVKVPKE